MLNRSRTAMALLLAASVFALPTGVLAAQSPDEDKAADKPASNTSNSSQRNASAPNAANRARISTGPEFYIAGPSRFVTSSSRNAAAGSPSRQQSFTEAELRQIRAAQQALLRQANPLAGPSRQAPTSETGGVLLSHPTLGRIVIGGATGGGEQDPAGLISTLIRQNPGLLMGPSPVSSPSGIKHDKGATSESGSGGSSSGSGGGAGSGSGGGGLPGDFPILEPGRGFSGPTAQPPAVGNPHLRGYDAKAIARWDVVPYQDFTGLFHIGVVAFHMNGIDRVEFSVNGGRWTPVTEMKLNPRTNVWEYTATLDASLFDDGLIEVRARVFPKNAGEVRVLAGEIEGSSHDGVFSMFLNANAGGTLRREVRYVSTTGNDETGDGSRGRPFRTIAHAAFDAADGDRDTSGTTIYLMPGSYEIGEYTFSKRVKSDRGWITIAGAPGIDRDRVKITGSGSGGLRTDMVRLANLTVEPVRAESPLRTSTRPAARLWLDNTVLRGLGPTSSLMWWNGFEQTYSTDVHVSQNRDGLSGLLIRNVTIENIGADAFSNARFVINSNVRNIDRGGTDFHPDVFQLYGPSQTFENIIVYGLHAYNANSQGIFARGLQGVKDTAFVNVLIELANPIMLSQWLSPRTEHVLFWHVTHLNKPFWFRVDGARSISEAVFKNVSFVGSVFETILDDANMVSGASFDHVHDIRGRIALPGVDITTGAPGFRNPAAGDYNLLPTSPLRDRVDPSSRRYRVWDDQGRLLDSAHVGAWNLRETGSD